MAILLDTGAVECGERSAMLHTMLTGVTAPHELRLHGDPRRMHARLEYWALDENVSVLHQHSSGITHTRDERHQGTDGPARVVFVLHDGGPGRYVNDDRRNTLERGGLYVTDLNSCYSYSRPGNGVVRILQVERSSLELTMEQVQRASLQLIASPLYDLLRHHVADLCAAAPRVADTAIGPPLAKATVRLAACMLETALSDTEPHRQSVAHDYLLDRMVLFIKANHAYADLDAHTIAAAHNISARQLFKIWASAPLSLNETIIAVRLDTARRMLERNPNMAIGAVSSRNGFVNPSHFSRRFRQAYGLSPRDVRGSQTTGTEYSASPS